jgi:uncharacterized protein YndB with AHSA1/START domain
MSSNQSTQAVANGVLEPAGDQWRLRFTRHLAHPPERVWRAIVEAEHRDTWFPQRVEGEWRVGAPLAFRSEYGDFDGEVLAFDPPSSVEFRWGTDTLRLEVRAEGAGSVLVLSDTFAEQGKAARDAAGWHVCLDALERALGANRPATEWQAVHPLYVRQFGPEAATIGPPAKPTA